MNDEEEEEDELTKEGFRNFLLEKTGKDYLIDDEGFLFFYANYLSNFEVTKKLIVMEKKMSKELKNNKKNINSTIEKFSNIFNSKNFIHIDKENSGFWLYGSKWLIGSLSILIFFIFGFFVTIEYPKSLFADLINLIFTFVGVIINFFKNNLFFFLIPIGILFVLFVTKILLSLFEDKKN